jgi:hypothetical protein
MKLDVITNEQGEVIATARAGANDQGIRVKMIPVVKGHTLHENVDVPDELVKLGPDELHKRVKQHLSKK